MTPADHQKARSSELLRYMLVQVEKEERVALVMMAHFREHCARDRQELQQAAGNANQTSLAFYSAINRAAFGNGPGSAEQAYAEDEQAHAKLAGYLFQVPVRERLWRVAIEAVRVEQVRRSEDVLRQIREDNSA